MLLKFILAQNLSFLLETIGVLFPTRNLREYSYFSAVYIKSHPSATCASAGKLLCRDVCIFRKQIAAFNKDLHWQFYFSIPIKTALLRVQFYLPYNFITVLVSTPIL
jgi:hypothetical protein